MNIERITNIDREKMGSFGILLVIDDVIYVCICTVYLYVFKEYTQHALVYDSHFSTLQNSEGCGAIIYNRSYTPICILEDKDRKSKGALKNILRRLFDGNCVVKYAFKVTANDSP